MACKAPSHSLYVLQNKFPAFSKASRSQARFCISMAGWFQLSSWGLVGWWGNKGWSSPKSECKGICELPGQGLHTQILYCKTSSPSLLGSMMFEGEEGNGLNTYLARVVVERPNKKVICEQTQYRSDCVAPLIIWKALKGEDTWYVWQEQQGGRCAWSTIDIGQSVWWWHQRDHRRLEHLRPGRSLWR